MKIEIFSDFVCPFCYIAKRELELAIEQAGYAGQVTIEMKAYELSPNSSLQSVNYIDSLIEHGMSREKVEQLTANITDRAKEVGLTYNFEEMTVTNTYSVHRLAKWMKQFSKEAEFTEAVMRGYFTQGLDLSRDDGLLAIVRALGLDEVDAANVLATDRFEEEVKRDQYDVQQIGVTRVPFFVFENRYGIIGAEPNEVFVRTLHQAAEIAGIQAREQQ
ncbi:DsbA family oxidoreductase [Solibacillus sp. CAU 1738]|uniref:DsbA family oxidoreductase n=1 Tax=Solibacillus sp. CAU 1738 TaxID=3140363 RepID=UPI0032610B62